VEIDIILKVSLNEGEGVSDEVSCLLATSTTIYSAVRIRLVSLSRAAKKADPPFSVSKTFRSTAGRPLELNELELQRSSQGPGFGLTVPYRKPFSYSQVMAKLPNTLV